MKFKSLLGCGIVAALTAVSVSAHADAITQTLNVGGTVHAREFHEFGQRDVYFKSFQEATVGLGVVLLTGAQWQLSGGVGISFAGWVNNLSEPLSRSWDLWYRFSIPSHSFLDDIFYLSATCDPAVPCSASASQSLTGVFDVVDLSPYLGDSGIFEFGWWNLTPPCGDPAIMTCGDSYGYLPITLSLTYTYEVRVPPPPPPSVPEPATLALLGLGLAVLGFSRRKQ